MKVYRLHEFKGADGLRHESLPDPTPGQGEVLLRIRAVSLNFRDLIVSNGTYNPKLRLPFVPVSDGAGEVIATGENASRFTAGARVVAPFMPGWLEGPPDEEKARSALGAGGKGMLAELVALPEQALLPIPAHLSFEEAASLPCAGVTAWNALFASGGLEPGDTVLTLGTGGVSLFAIQFAAAGWGTRDCDLGQRPEACPRTRAWRHPWDQLPDDQRLGQEGPRADRRERG